MRILASSRSSFSPPTDRQSQKGNQKKKKTMTITSVRFLSTVIKRLFFLSSWNVQIRLHIPSRHFSLYLSLIDNILCWPCYILNQRYCPYSPIINQSKLELMAVCVLQLQLFFLLRKGERERESRMRLTAADGKWTESYSITKSKSFGTTRV